MRRVIVPIAATALLVVIVLWLTPGEGGYAATGDVVLYPSDVSLTAGMWRRVPSSTGAGGEKMTTPDTGWSAAATPLASPTHFFEIDFDAPQGIDYHVWLRLRGAADSKWNESVWVQFSNAVDSSGTALWPIGSTTALLVNLEDCSNCGVVGWGWQDNASWTGQQARIRFRAGGRHTMRVQVREDGVDLDQIVLSPEPSASPGVLRNDTTIVPKSTAGVTLVRQPYLQQVTSSSGRVVWATREGGPSTVQYRTGSAAVRSAQATSRRVLSAQTGLPFDFYHHEAALTDLAASTTYLYEPVTGGVRIAGDELTTAPSNGSGTVRFIAFGDSGVGSDAQRQLAAVMTPQSFDFALHTGDVAYGVPGGVGAGSYPQLHSWFFDVYRQWLRRRPVFPSIGNHDDEANRAAPYRDVFVLPASGATSGYPDHAERFYSFDFGPAHFVVLDTELAFQDVNRRQAQRTWLLNDLTTTPQPWKIAVLHRPPYSASGGHGSDLAVRAEFGPIFEQYGVALVISGHDHKYERSVPWRESATGQAVTYIVTGGGGAPLYPVGTAPWTAVSRSAFHYVRAAITGCRGWVEAFGLNGAVFDTVAIDRCTPPPATGGPFRGVRATIPGDVQAEHFDEGGANVGYRDADPENLGGQFRATGVDIRATSDVGGGYNIGWMTAGEWLAYSVDITRPGVYTISARVAAAAAGGVFHIEVDDTDVTGPLAVPNTGGWQTWQSVDKTGVQLPGGRHRLRVVLDRNGPTGVFGNLNYLRLTTTG